jgi:hypothetical protein
MKKTQDVPSRSDITDQNDQSAEDMDKKEEELEITALDVETLRELHQEVDFETTEEGSEQLDKSIAGAESAAITEFDKEDEELEQIQEENQELEDDLSERENLSESNLDKTSEAESKINTKEALDEIVRLQESINDEIGFLDEQIKTAHDARHQSDIAQKELQNRVHKHKNR